MLNQLELIERAREAVTRREGRAETVSYYRISKELGITSAYMSQLREGRAIMSSDLAVKLGELAGLPLAYVAACIEHDRAQRSGNAETSGVWKAIAETFAGKAAAVMLSVLLLAGLVPHQAHAAGAGPASQGPFIHYAKYGRRLRRWLAARWPSRRTVWRSIQALSLA